MREIPAAADLGFTSIVARRGRKGGLIYIFAALPVCPSYVDYSEEEEERKEDGTAEFMSSERGSFSHARAAAAATGHRSYPRSLSLRCSVSQSVLVDRPRPRVHPHTTLQNLTKYCSFMLNSCQSF